MLKLAGKRDVQIEDEERRAAAEDQRVGEETVAEGHGEYPRGDDRTSSVCLRRTRFDKQIAQALSPIVHVCCRHAD